MAPRWEDIQPIKQVLAEAANSPRRRSNHGSWRQSRERRRESLRSPHALEFPLLQNSQERGCVSEEFTHFVEEMVPPSAIQTGQAGAASRP